MNHLPRETWWAFYEGKDHYMQLRQRWSWLHNAPADPKVPRPKLEAAHYLLYAILRGQDWRKGFTMFTNRVKRVNGYYGAWGGNVARLRLAMMVQRARMSKGPVVDGPEGTRRFQLAMQEGLRKFLEPFGGLVTPAMLIEVLAAVRMDSFSCGEYAMSLAPQHAYRITDSTGQLVGHAS